MADTHDSGQPEAPNETNVSAQTEEKDTEVKEPTEAAVLRPQRKEDIKRETAKQDTKNEVSEPMEDKDGVEEHMLQNEWTFWFDRIFHGPTAQKQYESNLQALGSFNTVEKFWRFHNHMNAPSEIPTNTNYHLFKTGIKPMWEDPANGNGGAWRVVLDHGREHLNAFWLNLVLALVGGVLDTEDEVCGVVMSRRKKRDRISVWNRSQDDERIWKLGMKLKSTLVMDVTKPPSFELDYIPHKVAAQPSSRYGSKKFSIKADFGSRS